MEHPAHLPKIDTDDKTGAAWFPMVKVATDGQHNIPYAVLLDDGAPVFGGGWRYSALFFTTEYPSEYTSKGPNPTRYAYAHVYQDELRGCYDYADETMVSRLKELADAR